MGIATQAKKFRRIEELSANKNSGNEIKLLCSEIEKQSEIIFKKLKEELNTNYG